MSLVARQATLPVRFTRACSSLKPVPAISQGGMHISAFINVTAFTSLAPHLLLANKADIGAYALIGNVMETTELQLEWEPENPLQRKPRA